MREAEKQTTKQVSKLALWTRIKNDGDIDKQVDQQI